MTEQRKNRLRRQLQESRYRLRKLNDSFASPLREMLFVATKDVYHLSTNGSCLYFDPDWLQKLGHTELDFILSHQLMHVALGHLERPKFYAGDRFHLACDIVANSQLERLGWRYEKLPHIGRIFHETFFPVEKGCALTAKEALNGIPFDPATLAPAARRNYMIDSEEWWDRKDDRGDSGIIVLSPQDEEPDDLVCDESTVGGDYFFVPREWVKEEKKQKKPPPPSHNDLQQRGTGWEQRVDDVLHDLRKTTHRDAQDDLGHSFTEKFWQRANPGHLDWRKLLDYFLCEEVRDYSFTPPDRRFQDSGFFLPDYNVITEQPKEILFFVDTSASVTDTMLAAVYSEISTVLTHFEGGLIGTLAFFDTQVYTPHAFSSISDLLRIKPHGGGGTDFQCIFDYVNRRPSHALPSSIVIFTDGQDTFPNEPAVDNIPILWLFSRRDVTPPWGKFAYINVG